MPAFFKYGGEKGGPGVYFLKDFADIFNLALQDNLEQFLLFILEKILDRVPFPAEIAVDDIQGGARPLAPEAGKEFLGQFGIGVSAGKAGRTEVL